MHQKHIFITSEVVIQSHLFLERSAEFSPCRKYRYALWRWWNRQLPYALFICLNPSKADEHREDNTSTRCIDYTMSWDFLGTRYGGTCVANLYGYCATDPEEMKRAEDPVGPDNDRWLRQLSAGAGLRVAAWGTHGTFMNRDKAVIELLPKPLYCLTLTKDGHPHHPLRLSRNLIPRPWI